MYGWVVAGHIVETPFTMTTSHPNQGFQGAWKVATSFNAISNICCLSLYPMCAHMYRHFTVLKNNPCSFYPFSYIVCLIAKLISLDSEHGELAKSEFFPVYSAVVSILCKNEECWLHVLATCPLEARRWGLLRVVTWYPLSRVSSLIYTIFV